MKLKGVLMAAAASVLMLGFVLEPVVALQSAKEGLGLFLTVVLPSLLPFMVCACLFIESGAAAAAGRALNGLMRPLFACPGEAAFALTAGLLSGYPTGARIAADLRSSGLIDDEDAARTGILASSCGPVFMLGAVGAGLLGNPAAGWLILLSHITGVILSGLLFSIGGNRKAAKAPPAEHPQASATVGALGRSIKKTVDTLWAVGGYIVLFSVISGLLRHYNALVPVAWVASPFLKLLGLEPALAQPMAVGLIEMTNGCSAVATSTATLANRCAAIALLVSFGGMCIQAQSMLFLAGVKLPMWKFMLSKAVQAALAFTVCRVLAGFPVFNAVLAGSFGAQALTPASALMSSVIFAAGGMLAFTALALFSGRASTRGSA